jgi:hypothetical protein
MALKRGVFLLSVVAVKRTVFSLFHIHATSDPDTVSLPLSSLGFE